MWQDITGSDRINKTKVTRSLCDTGQRTPAGSVFMKLVRGWVISVLSVRQPSSRGSTERFDGGAILWKPVRNTSCRQQHRTWKMNECKFQVYKTVITHALNNTAL